MHRLHQETRRAMAAAGIAPDALVVVGCSFGPDSLALADALLTLGQPVILAYVDHGLRPESGDEAEKVAGFAAARGARSETLRVVVDRSLGGLENAARDARLAALEGLADRAGAAAVVLGHTASDQAETVLMRLLQGAGPVGLAGILPVRGRFVRPLLGVSREEIEAYLGERGLEPVRDPMNDDRTLLRARIRHEIVPALAAINPKVRDALCRTAASAAGVREVVAWATEEARARVVVEGGWSVPALAALPPLLAKRLLTVLVPIRWSARHLDAALALCGNEAGSARLDLPGGTLVREYGVLRWAPEQGGEVQVDVRGGGAVSIRRWQRGDRMRPASLAGRSRKLSDLYTDRKVPARLRPQAVVIVSQDTGEIVWAEHVGNAIGQNLQVALTRSHIPANSQ